MSVSMAPLSPIFCVFMSAECILFKEKVNEQTIKQAPDQRNFRVLLFVVFGL